MIALGQSIQGNTGMRREKYACSPELTYIIQIFGDFSSIRKHIAHPRIQPRKLRC
jgi:hypothetical protein